MSGAESNLESNFSNFWSLQLKNSLANVVPSQTIKLTNATLGSHDEGRTAVFVELGSQVSPSPVPLFHLTPENDHRCLDVVLFKDRTYKILADGPNTVFLVGYSLAHFNTNVPFNSDLAHTSSTGSSASAVKKRKRTVNTDRTVEKADGPSGQKIAKVDGPSGQNIAKADGPSGQNIAGPSGQNIAGPSGQNIVKPKSPSGFLINNVLGGSGIVAETGNPISVSVKATTGEGPDDETVIFENPKLFLVLDDKRDYPWKKTVTGMKVGGVRLIRLPPGKGGNTTDQEMTIEVKLLNVYLDDA